MRYAGPLLLGTAFAAIAATAALGPSATQAPLGRYDDPATPPWHLSARPPAGLVTGLLALAVVTGTAALALGLSGRWRPRPGRLLAAGVLAASALSVLPPIGSADSLSYAAYGRMVTTGHDPWTTTPRDLARGGDPVGRAVEVPWQDAPSVYGPVATAEQAAAAEVGGTDVAVTVLVLQLIGAAVFVGAGLLLHRVGTGQPGRRRAALLWTANPLLWLQLSAGGHVDVLAAGAALAAVVVAARHRIAAGALAGLAASVKAPVGLVWLGLAWSARRSRRAVLELALGAAVVVGVGYGIAGTAAARQLARASRMVSLGTPWRWLADGTDPLLGHGVSRRVVGGLALLVLSGIVAVLAKRHPDVRAGTPAGVALALTAGYVLAAPYALPWYDAVPWVLLPLVAATRLDWFLLAHTTVLSLAYLPGRKAAVLSEPLRTVTSGMRTVISPLALTLLLLTLLLVSQVWRPSRGRP